MPLGLKANAPFRLDDYVIGDDEIEIRLTCLDPGPGQQSNHRVKVSLADLVEVGLPAPPPPLNARALIQRKLDRKIRAAGLTTILDALIGQTFTV